MTPSGFTGARARASGATWITRIPASRAPSTVSVTPSTGSVTDPNAPRERAKLVGDIVMEVRPDGRKVNEWRLLDLLDPILQRVAALELPHAEPSALEAALEAEFPYTGAHVQAIGAAIDSVFARSQHIVSPNTM